ncbi:MAG: hypothetical protein LC667_15445 [Thioalkalivibrio sp.]|nr:hypothetical protein [Thioalkalivibrio sp.]
MTRTFVLNARSLLFAGCALLLMSSSVSPLDREGIDALYRLHGDLSRSVDHAQCHAHRS